jgi:uncharacterized membrane protein YozB (DUF420 family)
MEVSMLWFHPVLQLLATLLGVYAAYLGMERALSRHFGLRTQFLWKRHVTVGTLATALWLGGMMGGLTVARLKWQVNFVTGDHYKTALVMLPLLLFALWSGLLMDRRKKARTILPVLHGVSNTVLLALAFYQIRTGWQVIKDFIL